MAVRILQIGDEPFEIYDECPDDWAIGDDYVRSIESLGAHVFRAISWMENVSYLIESSGKVVELPIGSALEVSRLIAYDEQARRGRPGVA